MHGHHSPVLALISIAVAICASYVAVDLSGRLHRSHGVARGFWLSGGSFAMGVGIWSMHFIGMLAFRLPVPVQYDAALVVQSVIVAVLASALALVTASRAALPWIVLAGASLLMGLAINGMHYIGMAAMRLPAVITWRPALVAGSIVIAVTASFLGLLLAFRLREPGRGVFRWRRLWAAIVFGMAISGMHYTGMAAARFTPGPMDSDPAELLFHTTGLSVAVIASTALILSLALAAAVFDERTRLLTREQRARHDAEVASRLKDEFLATLSHELRTPLNVIVGRTQMLQLIAHRPEEVREAALTIARNGEALSRLVEDLLDVSRISLGSVRLDWQPLDFAALVEAVAAGMRPTAEAKGIRFVVEIERGVPRMRGDQTRLQQIVWNLLTNGIKFTPRGGELRVRLTRADAELRLAVSDTGQGIDPAFVPFVFDMFRQAESSSRRAHGGLGIGLSVVRRLVELHGGTVTATSAGLGQGATFTVSLPLQTTAPAAQSAASSAHASPVAPSL